MVRPLGLMVLFGGLLATLAFFLGALGLRLRRARLTITTVKRSESQSFGKCRQPRRGLAITFFPSSLIKRL